MPQLSPQYLKPSHFLVHISDTHLIGTDEGIYNSTAHGDTLLATMLEELEASGSKPDAVVITGDLTDEGDSVSYEKLLKIVEPFAERIGTEIIWVMGNHDDRVNFREILLNETASTDPIDKVYDLNGLRLISLDTSVIGHHYGEVSESQLEWLAKILETEAPNGTILAMHHPPIPSVLDLAVTVELKDQNSLAKVLEGSDIRTIIAGHLHYSSSSTFAGIPVSVATSSCYTQDLNVEVGGTRGQDGAQGFNLVHFYENVVLHSVVPMGKFPTVGKFVSAKETQSILTTLY